MKTAQTIGGGLTFEEVWAIVQENAQGMRELRESIRELRESQMKASDEQRKDAEERRKDAEEQRKAIEEQRKAADEQRKAIEEQRKDAEEQRKAAEERRKAIDEQIKATGEQMKATDQRIGKLSSRFGEMVEYMVMPNLVAKFRDLGFEFTKAGQDVKITDREHGIFAEVDAFLENGDKAMIVEIKTKPSVEDVDNHAQRMGKLRAYAGFRGDHRSYLGAVAGVILNESVAAYALKNGFYVIEPSGDTFTITAPPRPRDSWPLPAS